MADFHRDLNQGHFHQNIEVLPLELKMEDVGKGKREKAGPSEGFEPIISEFIVQSSTTTENLKISLYYINKKVQCSFYELVLHKR